MYPCYKYSLHDESSFYDPVFFIFCELIVQQENSLDKKCIDIIYVVIMTKNLLLSAAAHAVNEKKRVTEN